MNKKDHFLHKAIPSRLREVAVSPNMQKQRAKQNKETEKYVPNKRTYTHTRKTSERDLNDMEIENFLIKNSK